MPDTALFCVFDGHSGEAAAAWCMQHFPGIVAKHAPHLLPEELTKAFLEADDAYLSMAVTRDMKDGSTATMVAITHTQIVAANLGDSRAVLSIAGVAQPLTVDHNVDLPEEAKRLRALGARIRGKYVRAREGNSLIAVTRSIGDKTFKAAGNPRKRILNAQPFVSYSDVTPETQFVIVASDGLWDVVDNQTAVNYVLELLAAGESARQIARKLVIKALNRRSGDNITVLVIVFPGAVFDFHAQDKLDAAASKASKSRGGKSRGGKSRGGKSRGKGKASRPRPDISEDSDGFIDEQSVGAVSGSSSDSASSEFTGLAASRGRSSSSSSSPGFAPGFRDSSSYSSSSSS
ncbi:uncharacterized protein AMSG_02040 [Thecamonas trahens ATCC 50062]|uniref:PPM-type phosphatase domain-containing protein n=1 Tax=Thecamonas trahens ATCC 50062 TaxID=461836 RepID=A0A0L0DWV8_THETB|nr:hypothetical protein AMSG_02040 [Thecamonas trahens ATCC 50062]KNC56028.1 hypothetical protein AMSG_02040 [Thecamonas trahens ATCC 50062]|eukprot:XP_013761072.1 hypothetical protein AMSG_02040 [Thecamonas trahens ATCC 50062]